MSNKPKSVGKLDNTSSGVIEGLRVRKQGTFSYKEIHNFVFNWFLKLGYTFAETKHVEKSGSSGREIESEWSGFRKVTGYVKFTANVSILLKDYKELVIEQNGHKIKTGIGRLTVTFNASINKNYEKVFSDRKGHFSNFLKSVYEKYVAKNSISDYEDKLEDEVLHLYEHVKDLAGS